MSILLDPSKSFIAIEIMYVEEKKTHGNSIFHFINNQKELEEWKRKGYQIKDSISKPPNNTTTPSNTKTIDKLTTWWKRISWKDQNNIFSKSIRQIPGPDGKLVTEIDMIRYRDLKLKATLKRWDLVDDSGESINVTDEIIDTLDPSVAAFLLNNFERVTEPTEDEKKD